MLSSPYGEAMNTTTTLDITELGERIATAGLGEPSIARDVVAVVALARASGVAAVPAGVLADLAAPDVVRERAFAAVARALGPVRRQPARRPVAA
jgi:hypothetical protein